MASSKKESEGIASLSMYGYEEEEEEEEDDEMEDLDSSHDPPLNDAVLNDPNTAEDTDPEYDTSSPQKQNYHFIPSPQVQQIVGSESERRRKGITTLTIVDYGHDEVAMSPEAEVLFEWQE